MRAKPTTTYRLRLDFPQARFNAPSASFAGNNAVLAFPFIAEKPLAAQAITVETINALATVTA